MEKKEILLFTPTPHEFAAVSRRLEGADLRHCRVEVIECGPGAINAAFRIAAAAAGRAPALIVGAGTCGSLDKTLTAGDMIASAQAVIADWLLEDEGGLRYGLYGAFDYRALSPETAEALVISCGDPLVARWLERLDGFRLGRLLTSDVFIAGRDNKLRKGRDFKALACDMESGVFAYAAKYLLGGLPWVNLRVVADTLDETLGDYFDKEADMTEILGAKTRLALSRLDELLGES